MSIIIAPKLSLEPITSNVVYKLIYDFSCNVLSNLNIIQSLNLNINQYGYIVDLLPISLRNTEFMNDTTKTVIMDKTKAIDETVTNYSTTKQIIILIKDLINTNIEKGVCSFIDGNLSIDIPNIQFNTKTSTRTISIMTIDISLYYTFFNDTTIITKFIKQFYGPPYDTYAYVSKVQALIIDFQNLKSLCQQLM
jgi:hypothetical protein